MAWGFLRGHKFKSQNFGTVFRQSELNFRDCFRIVGIVFEQSRIVLRFGFNLETDVFGFC